jgi:hypothetical protein
MFLVDGRSGLRDFFTPPQSLLDGVVASFSFTGLTVPLVDQRQLRSQLNDQDIPRNRGNLGQDSIDPVTRGPGLSTFPILLQCLPTCSVCRVGLIGRRNTSMMEVGNGGDSRLEQEDK